MITLQELSTLLNSYLECSLFNDYCPNGLQVEGKKKSIRKVATAVSASLDSIIAAVEWGADALIVHHGIFWKNDAYPIIGVKSQKLSLLIENDISLFAYHLPLDAHTELGNNWKAAKELGGENLQPLEAGEKPYIGVKTTFKTTAVDIFIQKLEEYYQHPAHVSLGGKETISSAAIVSGAAWRLLPQVATAGVDAFITGAYDEPAWHIAREEQINFLALGHAATERVGPRSLAHYLQEKLSLQTTFLDLPNPF